LSCWSWADYRSVEHNVESALVYQAAAGIRRRRLSLIRHFLKESNSMKPLSLAGVALVIAGLAGLILGHISFTTEKKIIDIGPITATTEEHHSIPIPDIAGIAAVVAGAALVFLGQRRA
jgi:hypothetical protein